MFEHRMASWLVLGALLAGPVGAQTTLSQDDAAARQRSTAAAMEDSLAKQRAAVEKQLGQTAGGSFFVLPRAASLGGVTGSVAAPPVLTPLPSDCDPLPPSQVDNLIGDAAEREGLSADLLRSVMKQESAFRPCAVSSKGAMGLMQLMPSTAEQFGIRNPFDPASNLDAGARFLKQLLTKYDGDVSKALGAYNAGPARVDAAGGVPAIPETMDYVKQIMGTIIH